tara:strand:+ start:418 stop:678 length:261 start_codon:yes stop_codon:yes gene_type:complete
VLSILKNKDKILINKIRIIKFDNMIFFDFLFIKKKITEIIIGIKILFIEKNKLSAIKKIIENISLLILTLKKFVIQNHQNFKYYFS